MKSWNLYQLIVCAPHELLRFHHGNGLMGRCLLRGGEGAVRIVGRPLGTSEFSISLHHPPTSTRRHRVYLQSFYLTTSSHLAFLGRLMAAR